MPRFRYPVPKSSEITPEDIYRDRRRFMQLAVGGSLAVLLPSAVKADPLTGLQKTFPMPEDPPTSFEHITQYNNFYEFGTDKESPSKLAGSLKTRPWTVSVDGEALKPRVFDIDELLTLAPLEERIYRLRCVEAWSMVVPWVGYPLAALLKRVEPTSRAKFVEFETLLDPQQMPGQQSTVLDWPYREALRMDEAMHPLALLTLGLYGRTLPNQNGAPVRVVLPWKYGFKSAKSIVRIRLVEQAPQTTWMKAGPREYGFYANVNPEVDHPRWSQTKERRIGEFFKRPTQKFNGYAEQVGAMYAGMDLARFF
jgi:sulfoxide reductase catalytic subunit YedY